MSEVLATGGDAFRDRLLVERRKIGAFYTPEPLSQILSDWAIRSPLDFILEPSFGGCGFLQCAQGRLGELGCVEPRKQIYGCDIDPVAFEYLADVFQAPVDLSRFAQTDFLDVSPGGEWPETFSVVLANPPYIPYQELGTERRHVLSSTKWLIDGVAGRASLWAYFLTHALSFLAKDGRMAWVLPGAFLQADYATPIMRDAGIAYEGIFGDAWPRWWAHRLESWAQSVFKRRATGLPASDRARILAESTGKEFEPARSPWNGLPNELISFACASCGRGTELRHSVAAFEPSQPRYLARRRICWDCVQKDQYEAVEPPLSIDDADKDLAEQVKGRERSEGHASGAEA